MFWRTGLDRWIGRLLPLTYLVAIVPIADLVYWVARRALPTFSWKVLTTDPSGASGGLFAPLVGTVTILLLATGVACALGVVGGFVTAEYLTERAAGWVRLSANVMAGIPAIVVGLFGYLAFVSYFGWGVSLAAASVTLGVFMTPYVFRATDLAYASVPPGLRDAALGAGARSHQYLARVATPVALPQVLSGVFLAMAIGVGETAPLYLTTLPVDVPPSGLLQPVSALTLYIWSGFQTGYILPSAIRLAFQAAFLLLVVVIALNVVVRLLGARSRRRLAGLLR